MSILLKTPIRDQTSVSDERDEIYMHIYISKIVWRKRAVIFLLTYDNAC